MKLSFATGNGVKLFIASLLSFFGGYQLRTAGTSSALAFRRSNPQARCNAVRAPPPSCPAPVPVLENRDQLGTILENEGFRRGVELGVQRGEYASRILQQWNSCEQYVLVDLWAPQENYHDGANVAQDAQDKIMQLAIGNTERWAAKVSVCRNFTTACAALYEDEYFDFVYVDARHDRHGVTQDLVYWWPKVRPGGLVCGHDFVTQYEGPAQMQERWDINMDGTVDPTGGAVRGAVTDWARDHERQLQLCYKEGGYWTWCLRK